MFNETALESTAGKINPATLERALRSASLDLQQVIVTVARRHLPSGRRGNAKLPTWQTLQIIDEQSFENLGFRGRHDESVRAIFSRFADSRLADSDLDEPVDWRRDDDDLPAVYLMVRELVTDSSAVAE